jgi:ribosome-associated heat shock protein Hsp15
MRLDKFLFFVRITKTRVLAQKLIAQGHVRLNGCPVQNGHQSVSVGDVITVPLGFSVAVIEILALPTRRGSALEARTHYRDPRCTQAIDASDVKI